MQDHECEQDQAKPPRDPAFSQRRDKHGVTRHLRHLDREPQRDPAKMDDRNEKRISAWPHETGPAIGRSPIPMLRRAYIPERIVLCRAPIYFLGVNDPELEKRQQRQSHEQAVTLPKLSDYRVTHHSENWRCDVTDFFAERKCSRLQPKLHLRSRTRQSPPSPSAAPGSRPGS